MTVLVGAGHCPCGGRSLSSGGVNPRLHLKHLHPNQSKGTVFAGSCFVYIVPVVSKATNILYGKHVSFRGKKAKKKSKKLKDSLCSDVTQNIYNNLQFSTYICFSVCLRHGVITIFG